MVKCDARRDEIQKFPYPSQTSSFVMSALGCNYNHLHQGLKARKEVANLSLKLVLVISGDIF